MWTSTRAAIAAEHRNAKARGREPDPVRLAELRQRLRAERAKDYLAGLNTEPRLTTGQLAELASVLVAVAGGGDAA